MTADSKGSSSRETSCQSIKPLPVGPTPSGGWADYITQFWAWQTTLKILKTSVNIIPYFETYKQSF
jgi:hypothetical protein